MTAALLTWALAVGIVVLGIIGTVVPALPGPVLVFAGLLIAAWADGFVHVGATTFVILGVLTVIAYGIDFLAAALGARGLGASNWALAGAFLGAVIGVFFGLAGVIVGPFVGAVVAEYAARGDVQHAGRAGVGAWIGLVLGVAAKLGLVFAMLAVFALAFVV